MKNQDFYMMTRKIKYPGTKSGIKGKPIRVPIKSNANSPGPQRLRETPDVAEGNDGRSPTASSTLAPWRCGVFIVKDAPIALVLENTSQDQSTEVPQSRTVSQSIEKNWGDDNFLETLLRNQPNCPFESEFNLKVNLCELFPNPKNKRQEEKWNEEINLL